MQRKIKFITNGSTSAFGSFANGDLLVCGADLARHYVEEARCARYDDEAAPPDGAPVEQTKNSTISTSTKGKSKKGGQA